MTEIEIRILLDRIERELRSLDVSIPRGERAPYFRLRVGVEYEPQSCDAKEYTRVWELDAAGRIRRLTYSGNRRLS